MMTTADVRDWLKTLTDAEHFYVGKLDNKPDKAIGVYTLTERGQPQRGIGQPLSYDVLAVSVLIHWNQNARVTEQAARSLYEVLYNTSKTTINGHAAHYIDLLVPESVDVGTDEKGVYERVIEMKIYYERE